MVNALFTTARTAAASAIRSAPAAKNIAIKRSPAVMLALKRRYTNTSVYTQGDGMSPEEQLQRLLAEQQYLIELLKLDDSNAPWQRQNADTVNREVQEGFPEPQNWVPEDAFRH
ncbi:hypothetical protein H4217_003263 [Coemansia sp. RSA 1939]|nr:hypothetical protein H4217_003263 [Coemansia sp. RSA 1939]